jgi:hypothetical protein
MSDSRGLLSLEAAFCVPSSTGHRGTESPLPKPGASMKTPGPPDDRALSPKKIVRFPDFVCPVFHRCHQFITALPGGIKNGPKSLPSHPQPIETRRAGKRQVGPLEPPKGAEDFSPWRKPWETGTRPIHSAPEGRKTSFPTISLAAAHAVFLEKAEDNVGRMVRESMGNVFRPSGAQRSLTLIESHSSRRGLNSFGPPGLGENSRQNTEGSRAGGWRICRCY